MSTTIDMTTAQFIINRATLLDTQISEELNAFITTVGPQITELEEGLQVNVNQLAGEINDLAEDTRATIQDQLNEQLGAFAEDFLAPAQGAVKAVSDGVEALQQQVDGYLEQITLPVETIEEWAEGLNDALDELKERVTETIEEQAESFITTTTDISDELLEVLQQQFERLAQFIEQWINDLTGLGDEALHKALSEHTQTLTTQITDGIDQLLDRLLARFDEYLQLAKQALLDAVAQGSASRETIEPALEQLEVVRNLIEAVVDQVESLANSVGMSL